MATQKDQKDSRESVIEKRREGESEKEMGKAKRRRRQRLGWEAWPPNKAFYLLRSSGQTGVVPYITPSSVMYSEDNASLL